MWEEEIPLCSTLECKYNDCGECTINSKDCPYLKGKLLQEVDK